MNGPFYTIEIEVTDVESVDALMSKVHKLLETLPCLVLNVAINEED